MKLKRLLLGAVLLCGSMFAAHAEDITIATPGSNQSTVTKADFVSAASAGTYANGDMFLIKINPTFYPENYGAYYSNNVASVDENYFKNMKFRGSGFNTYAEYVFDESVSSVVQLTGIATTSNDVTNRRGTLYAYDGDLSRFIFAQRSDLAYSTNTDVRLMYNPYKTYQSSGYNFVGNKRFIEYSVHANDILGNSTVKDGTYNWYQTMAETSVTDKLEVFQHNNGVVTNYGRFDIGHDCINATMRTHYIHMYRPQNVTQLNQTSTQYQYQTGETTTKDYHSTWEFHIIGWQWVETINPGHDEDGSCCTLSEQKEFKSSYGTQRITKTVKYRLITTPQYNTFNAQAAFDQFSADPARSSEGKVFLLFVPNGATTSNFLTNLNEIVGDYQPYIQFFKGVIWYAEDGAPTDQNTYDEAKFWQHDLKWIDTAMDKFRDSGESYIVNYRRRNADNTYGEWRQYEIQSAREMMEIIHQREDNNYYVQYYVTCIINGLGVSVRTNTVELIVPGNRLGDVNLEVSSFSQAIDVPTEPGKGHNLITHNLDITISGDVLEEVAEGSGTFTIKHYVYDVQNGEVVLGEDGEPVIVSTSEQTLTVTGANTCSDGTNTYTFVNGKTTFPWTGITYDYNADGSLKDNYEVFFTSGELVDHSTVEVAPYYRTDFYAGTLANETLSYEPYLYFYSDKIAWQKVDLDIDRYFARSINDNNQFNEGEAGEVYKNAESNFIGNEVYKTSGIYSNNAELHENVYVGYIEFPATGSLAYGTWGVGTGTAPHQGGKVFGSKLIAESYAHNQVLPVWQQKDHDSAVTDAIWNSPIASLSNADETEIRQIFPGTDIDFTIDAVVRGLKDESQIFDTAYGVVIYKVNPETQTVERITPEGTQYFNKIVAGESETLENGVVIPTFVSGDRVAPGRATQNIIYDFTDGAKYTYDAFVFYISPSSGKVTTYAHSGGDLISDTAPYGSFAYANQLPVVKSAAVSYPEVQVFSGADVVAGSLNIGGFAYMVVDMEKAEPQQTPEATDRSDYAEINSAVNRYRIQVTQDDTNLDVFTPYMETTTNIASSTPFAGMDYNSTNIDVKEMFVYPTTVAVQEDDNISEEDGFAQTVKDRDAEHNDFMLASADKYVLVGVRGITGINPQGINRAPSKADNENKSVIDVDHADMTQENPVLAQDLKLHVQPLYTIARPVAPVMGIGAFFNSTRYRINYRSDVANNGVNNDIKIDESNDAGIDYSTNNTPDPSLYEDGTINFKARSVVTGIDDTLANADLTVRAEGLCIIVEGDTDMVIVFDAASKQVYAGTEKRISVAQPGVYMVAANGQIFKVAVK